MLGLGLAVTVLSKVIVLAIVIVETKLTLLKLGTASFELFGAIRSTLLDKLRKLEEVEVVLADVVVVLLVIDASFGSTSALVLLVNEEGLSPSSVCRRPSRPGQIAVVTMTVDVLPITTDRMAAASNHFKGIILTQAFWSQ